MKTELEITCDVKLWEEMPPQDRLPIMLQASMDIEYFWGHPALGSVTLWPAQARIMKDFYQLKEGGKRKYSELIFVSGMRGGKTTTASCIGLTEIGKLMFMDSPAERYNLAKNSEIMCINVAPSEPQALDTVFKRSKELVANSPYFASHLENLTYNTMKWPKNLTTKALGSNSGSGVGRTVKCFVADEVSRFQDSDKKQGAKEVYNTISKSTATFKPWNENVRVAISSPLYDGDMITTLHHNATDEKWEWALPIWEATWNLNPNLTLEVLEEERKKDPISFDRDFGAQAIQEIETFFNAISFNSFKSDILKNTNLFMGEPSRKSRSRFVPDINLELLKIAPNAIEYVIATDPAIKNDAFGLAIGHLTTDYRIIIDGATVFIAGKNEEIDTEDISRVLDPLLKTLPIRTYLFDIYFHTELQKLVRTYGITPMQHHLNLLDWTSARGEVFNKNAILPGSNYLVKELSELQLIRSQKVDHPPAGSKDCADAVCQIISYFKNKESESKNSGFTPGFNLISRF